MDQYCLVLTGRFLQGQDPEAAHARMAEAFGMEGADFRKRVFERAPLLIRRGLDRDAAEAQAAQLEAMGVEAHAVPGDAPLVWLLREGQIRGPLPEAALARYALPGDQWCHDGGQQWFPWTPADAAAEPPPLPAEGAARAAAPATPPPMPSPVPRTPPWAIGAAVLAVLGLLWHALAPVALLLGLVTLLWLLRRPGTPGRAWAVAALLVGAVGLALWLQRPSVVPSPAVAQPYVPRPLQPLQFAGEDEDDAITSADAGHCAATAPAPHGEEDRFLLTGGQRLLTGRAQRRGDTYVAEAAASFDRACQPESLQLYVFRGGVFVGTALEQAVSAASAKLADFQLDDDQHLSITLVPCKDGAADCGAPAKKQAELLHQAGGWIVRQAALAKP
jgi:hypothetical protein